MTSLFSRFLALQGWAIFAAMFSMAWMVLAPQYSKLVSQSTVQQDLLFRIEQYEKKLKEPLPPDENARYSAFVFDLPIGTSVEQFEPELQSRLLTTVRSNQARLIGLTNLTSKRDSKSHLTALQFRLEIEGHYVATTAVLQALSSYSEPLLIDQLSIQPSNRSGRPDANLKTQLLIRILIEEVE